MSKIYDIFEMVLPRKNSKVSKKYLKSHKVRESNFIQKKIVREELTVDNLIATDNVSSVDTISSVVENNNVFSIEEYNKLISDLYNLKITNPSDFESISKLEFQAKEL